MSRTPGRPREHGQRKTTAIRIAPGLLNKLKHEAIDRDVSVNYLIVRAIEDWLKKNGKKGRR